MLSRKYAGITNWISRRERPSKVTKKAKEKTPGLAREIVSTLRERILSWRYPPLYRLTEELICSEFNVSRSPAREALRILETDGLLNRLNNRGFVVKQPDQREVEELYEIRFALELYAIQVAAEKKLGAQLITALRKTWKALKANPNRDVETLARLDVTFHETLIGLLGNKTLSQKLTEINERLFAFRLIDFGKPHRVSISCDEHLRVLDCLRDGDAFGSREALMNNIEGSRATARSALLESLSRSYENI
jgi:DNA-binding GntR family transcriptional regulator